jgi:hypothetical protein
MNKDEAKMLLLHLKVEGVRTIMLLKKDLSVDESMLFCFGRVDRVNVDKIKVTR